jgi:SpoVK/Ycf46/Vps4 family AAA+-type ATPase
MPIRLREEIKSSLKRFDHNVASEKHVLFGLLRISTDEAISNRLAYLDEITDLLQNSKPPIDESSSEYTEKAEYWLEKIKVASNPASVFPELAVECGLQISEEVVEKFKAQNSNVATQEKSDNVKISSSAVANELSDMSLEEAMSELDSMIGLDSVKKQINSLISTHRVNRARVDKGLPEIPQSLHLVFSGDPGTGKTTVARIVSQIYKSLEILPVGHLVEVSRADLVAGYVGQTALKVQEVIDNAFGGVLFIDEAYSLSFDAGAGFGSEAISTLLQNMENKRGRFAVIAAGYTEQMKDFVVSNPGLRSRFQTFIDFPNYNSDQLYEIFKKFSNDYHLKINPSVEQKLKEHFKKGNFGGEAGNARYVRSLFETMFANLAHRAHEDGIIEDHELEEFTESDIPNEPIKGMSTGNKIGFS